MGTGQERMRRGKRGGGGVREGGDRAREGGGVRGGGDRAREDGDRARESGDRARESRDRARESGDRAREDGIYHLLRVCANVSAQRAGACTHS